MPLRRAKRVKRSRKARPKKGITWKSIRKANKKRPPSSLELIAYGWLDEAGIAYKKEKAIGRCHVDLFIDPDIAIELQGCYFHKCPLCYPAKTKSDKSKLTKDRNRLRFIRSKGYNVIEIWEHDVLKFPDATRERILALTQRK